MSLPFVTRPSRSLAISRAAAATYAIRGIRDYVAGHPELQVRFRTGRPLAVDAGAPLPVQQAQVIELIAYGLSTTAGEFVAFRTALGLTYDCGQPCLSERAADSVNAIEEELAG